MIFILILTVSLQQRKKGRIEKKYQIAKKMQAKGLDIDSIMEITSLTVEEIENL